MCPMLQGKPFPKSWCERFEVAVPATESSPLNRIVIGMGNMSCYCPSKESQVDKEGLFNSEKLRQSSSFVLPG